ncbi:hypothetical protein O6H91_Y354700 [Diphasiastrum complanatum]|nr:hypothetical protein O6H91_Y354700 [Diphasiastrum complanatum]
MAKGRWRILLIAILLLLPMPDSVQARKLSDWDISEADSSKVSIEGIGKTIHGGETFKAVDEGLGLSKLSQSYMCLACLELSKDAQELLSSPETERIAVEFFSEHICHRLTAQSERKCEEMIDAYIPLILLRLQDRFAPDRLCSGDQYCHNDTKISFNHEDVFSMVLNKVSDVFRYKKSTTMAKQNRIGLWIQEKILHILLEGCEEMHIYIKECKLVFRENGLQALTNLDKLYKPMSFALRRRAYTIMTSTMCHWTFIVCSTSLASHIDIFLPSFELIKVTGHT